MNDNFKNQMLKSAISDYTNEITQLIDGVYSDFLANHSVSDFKTTIEKYTDSKNEDVILSKIKSNFLLNNQQKDALFKIYYNGLIDGCEKNITDINEKCNIRQIILNNLLEKKIFHDNNIIGELVYDKFQQEVKETKQKIEQLMHQQAMQRKQMEQEQQSQPKQESMQPNIEQNTVQNKPDVNMYDDATQQGNAILSGETVERKVYEPIFTANDFYRYRNISNMIGQISNEAIYNAYLSVRKKIVPNLNETGNALSMNSLMQKQKLIKNKVEPVYSKTNKKMNNFIDIDVDKRANDDYSLARTQIR